MIDLSSFVLNTRLKDQGGGFMIIFYTSYKICFLLSDNFYTKNLGYDLSRKVPKYIECTLQSAFSKISRITDVASS